MKTNTNTNGKTNNGKNVRANVQTRTNKETATQKAARMGKAEQEREKKAAEKAAEKAAKAAARAEKLAAQKAATAERKENAKCACKYNFYGVINDEHTATPFAACKHFYIDMQSACGGALLVVLSRVIGKDKREFAEMYANRVKKYATEKGNDKFTAFMVWRVLWKDLKKYTTGEMKADKETSEAVEKLCNALDKRTAKRKAEQAKKAKK